MTEAKLFILGQEIELIWCDMNYYRDIRMDGKPATEIMGGLIKKERENYRKRDK